MTTVQTELYGSVAAELPRVCDLLDAQLASDDACVQALLGKVAPQHGKMLRPALVLLSGRALGRCTEDHYALAAVVEMIHMASLVHDDVIDEADARRNMPSANRTLGNEGAVLLGDYIVSAAFRLCNSLRSHEANDIFGGTCNMICLGELIQVAHRRNLQLSEAEYLDIIAKKTAGLIRACAVFGAVFADADARCVDRLAEYGHNLGMAFQITDDVLDFTGDQRQLGKPVGSDLRQGLLTLPALSYRDANPGDERLARIADHGRPPEAMILGLIADIVGSGAIQASLEEAERFGRKARQCLETLPESPYRRALEELAEFTLARNR